MRPNLSVEKIAGALAVLGTSVLMAACGGDNPPANTPVNANETTPPAASGDAKPADGHCGAGKEHKPGEASCGAGGAKPADTSSTSTTPAAATPATTPASGTSTPASATPAADPKAATDPKATEQTDPKKPGTTPAAGGKKGGGASCGAGTCSPKK
jgi:hypothetical protein